MVIAFRLFRRVHIFRSVHRFFRNPTSDKIGCFVERGVHADAVDEQNTIAILHNGIFCIVIHLVYEAFFLGFRCRPPVCFIHPLGAFILSFTGLLGVQSNDAAADGFKCFQTVLHVLCGQVVANAHADRMNHVAAVCRCHNFVRMAGNDGGGACAQPVNVGGHGSGIAFQHIANGLGRKNVTTAGVDVYGDFFHIAQGGKVVRKPFRGRCVLPPAALRNIAIKQQFRFLVIVGQIAELPELIIR